MSAVSRGRCDGQHEKLATWRGTSDTQRVSKSAGRRRSLVRPTGNLSNARGASHTFASWHQLERWLIGVDLLLWRGLVTRTAHGPGSRRGICRKAGALGRRRLARRLRTRSCRLGLTRSAAKPTIRSRGACLRGASMGPHQRRDSNDVDLSQPFVGEPRDADACSWLAVGVCVQILCQHSPNGAFRLRMGVGRRIDG